MCFQFWLSVFFGKYSQISYLIPLDRSAGPLCNAAIYCADRYHISHNAKTQQLLLLTHHLTHHINITTTTSTLFNINIITTTTSTTTTTIGQQQQQQKWQH